MRKQHSLSCAGFTLLEVILALAILGVAMATLGHAVRLSHQQAERAALESDAALVAESVLAELLSGVRSLVDVQREPYIDVTSSSQEREEASWQITITIANGPVDGTIAMKVLVEPTEELLIGLAPVEIVRWAADPDLATEEGGL